MAASDDPRIPTNLRLLLILEAIGGSEDPAAPAEIGRQLGLSKQTVHRLCNTLLHEGFLVRDEAGRGLRPGRRARLLGAAVLHASSAHIARHQVLMALAAAVGETVNFAIPEDRGMVYQDRVETDWAFRIQLPVGSHVPFHCTATGKAYMASLPMSERRRMLTVMALTKMTENTITDAGKMMAELAEIARQGYALDREEFIEGMVAIAVPVVDTAGRYVASVAFHGPVQRLTIEDAVGMRFKMLEASRKLTQTIFG